MPIIVNEPDDDNTVDFPQPDDPGVYGDEDEDEEDEDRDDLPPAVDDAIADE